MNYLHNHAVRNYRKPPKFGFLSRNWPFIVAALIVVGVCK